MRFLAYVALLAVALGGAPAAADEASAVAPAGTTERVAVTADGQPADAAPTDGALSGDGRYVAFTSRATNLVPGAGGEDTVFVRDRVAGTVRLVGAGISPGISADGGTVTFAARSSSGSYHVHAHDRATGDTELVSAGPEGPANRGATNDGVSADGRFVVFTSSATNLLPETASSPLGENSHVYLKDRHTGALELVSVSSDGTPGDLFSNRGAVSADGRRVAFQSMATNLDDALPVDRNAASYDVYVRDREARTTVKASVATDGTRGSTNSYCPAISGDGRFVAFPSYTAELVPADANRAWDVFVRDLDSGRTERAEVTSAGAESSGSGWPWNCGVGLSHDGRHVLFTSLARNLVEGDTQDIFHWEVFLHDRHTGQTEKAAVADDGTQGDRSSMGTAISADGRFVLFRSLAALVSGPGTDDVDLYVRDRGPLLDLGGVHAATGGETATVTGWANVAGTVLAAGADAPSPLAPTGADLVGASVAHRPFHGDLLVRWDVSELPAVRGQGLQMGPSSVPLNPGVAGAPGVVYGLDLTVAGEAFQVRGMRGNGLAELGLYRCAAACELVTALDGSVGTAGEDVRAAVPLAAVGAAPGAALTGLRAWTALGVPQSAAPVKEIALDDVVLPARRVELGAAPAGAPPHSVVFDRSAELRRDGRFSAAVPVPAGHALWARACRDADCGPPARVATSATG